LRKTKQINYRGILEFQLPADWVEEYDDNLGGTFYEDDPLSGTLRLNLMTLRAPSGELFEDASVILDNIIPKGSDSILLSNNNAFKMFYEQTTESDHEITINYWSLLNYQEPNHVRLANFSYTILNSRLELDSVRKEIDFITEKIKEAEFKVTKDI